MGVLTGFPLYLFSEKEKRMSFQSLTHIESLQSNCKVLKSFGVLNLESKKHLQGFENLAGETKKYENINFR